MLTCSHSRHVEKYLATEAPHKHLVFVLNKIDLVPSSTAVSFVSLQQISLIQSALPGPRALVRTLPAYPCFMGERPLRPWESDLHFQLPWFWSSDQGLIGFRFGILSPDTGRVSDELKAATVRFGRQMAVFLVMIHTFPLH